jgi:hypothetical protein
MNEAQVIERLRALPPDLLEAPDRLERVATRVHRRRKRNAAASATGTVLGAILLVTLIVQLGVPDGRVTRGVDPATSSTSAVLETSSSPIPGADRIEPLSDPIVHFGTGTETVDLGPRPPDATAVSTGLACLTAGHIEWPDGAGMVCNAADVQAPDEVPDGNYQLDLRPEQTTVKITAREGMRWKLVATYIHVEPTDWATNAKGDTYGTIKNDGSRPDLLYVWATNGRMGYAYLSDMEGYQPSSPADALAWQREHGDDPRTIPVYESDGNTVIGEFVITPGEASYDP